MQEIKLDLTARDILPRLLAKQGDVGRKFRAVITDNGEAYQIPADALLSVWYSGTSGEGNYSTIGENSAFSIDGNTVTVELITQMLTNYGGGNVCLVMNRQDGTQIGTWNIPYIVEQLPGMGSSAAEQYFTALSEVAGKAAESAAKATEAAATFETDESLSVAGKAADAAATGEALAGKAPAVYTYPSINGIDANTIVNEYHKFVINCSNCAYDHGFLDVEKAGGEGFSPNGAVPIIQQTMRDWSTGHKAYRTSVDNGATWGEWIYETPPMQVGVAYRTAERRNGKPVYIKLVDFGLLPANDSKSVDIGIQASRVFALDGSAYSAISNELVPIPTGYSGVLGAYAYAWGSVLYVRSMADLSTYSAAFVIKYV